MLQDQEGALWAGTARGLGYFNGVWVSIPGTQAAVYALAQTGDGTLWAGTSEGLWRLPPEWTRVPVLGVLHWQRTVTLEPVEELNAPTGSVNALAVGMQGELLVGTDTGLWRWMEGAWEAVQLPPGVSVPVSALAVTPPGHLWVGTEQGVAVFDGQAWTVLHAPNPLPGETVNALLVDPMGRVWVGTDRGAVVWDGRAWHTLDFLTYIPQVEGHLVWSLAAAPDGTVWVGTNGQGVWQVGWDEEGGRLTPMPLLQLTTADGLAGNVIFSISVDEDNVQWFGTPGGVTRRNVVSWQRWVDRDPIAESTAVLVTRQGEVLVGTDGLGLRQFHNGGWISKDDALIDYSVNLRGLAEAADGSLWIAVNQVQLIRYDGRSWVMFTAGEELPDGELTALLGTQDGSVWVGTLAGLARWDGERWQIFTQADGLPSDRVKTLVEGRDGAVWVGTERGVARWRDGAWERFESMAGVSNADVRTLFVDREGRVWAGVWGVGIIRWDGETWQMLADQSGLISRQITRLWVDRQQGHVWVATPSGVSRYDGETWHTYEAPLTIPIAGVHDLAEAPNGDMWFATQWGPARYHPLSSSPWVQVETVNGQEPVNGEVSLPAPAPLVIIARGGDLHTTRRELLFQGWLEGVDQGWRTLMEGRATYGRVGPGTYTFRLRVRDPDFNYSPEVQVRIHVPLTVRLPYLGDVLVSIALPLALSVLIVGSMGGWWIVRYVQHRQRTAEAIARHFNPYISGEPVRDPRLFYGRDELLTRMLTILHRNSVMVHGARRSGKTSLLHQLARILRETEDPDYRFYPVYVDLEGVPQDAFFTTLMEEIVHQLKEDLPEDLPLNIRLTTPHVYTPIDFRRDLRAIIRHLSREETRSVRLVLLLDEVDVMNGYDQAVQQQLRRLFMETFAPNLGAVVAGVEISKAWDREESPWYNMFYEVSLTPISKADGVRLIREPVADVYTWDADAVEFVWEKSGGQPFRIQQLCLEAVNHMLVRRKSRVTREDARAAYEAVKAADPTFDVDGGERAEK